MSHLEIIAYAKACGLGKDDAERLWALNGTYESPVFAETWDRLDSLVRQIDAEREQRRTEAMQPVMTHEEWQAKRQRELAEESRNG